jgi:hypothetical protein
VLFFQVRSFKADLVEKSFDDSMQPAGTYVFSLLVHLGRKIRY